MKTMVALALVAALLVGCRRLRRPESPTAVGIIIITESQK